MGVLKPRGMAAGPVKDSTTSPQPHIPLTAHESSPMRARSPLHHHRGHTAVHTPAGWPRCPACCARHPSQTGQYLHGARTVSSANHRPAAPHRPTTDLLHTAAQHGWWPLQRQLRPLPSPGNCLTAVALISASGSRASCWTKGSSTSTQSPYAAVGPAAAAAIPCNETHVGVKPLVGRLADLDSACTTPNRERQQSAIAPGCRRVSETTDGSCRSALCFPADFGCPHPEQRRRAASASHHDEQS